MTRMLFRSAVAVGAGLLPFLAACESDPAKGGFLSGVYNLSTGGYEQRVGERQRTLDQARVEQAALARERAEVEREYAEVARELSAAEDQVHELERRILALKRQLRSEHAAYADQQKGLQQAEVRLASMGSSIRQLEAADDPIAIRHQRIAGVNRTLDELASIVDSMTEDLPPTRQ